MKVAVVGATGNVGTSVISSHAVVHFAWLIEPSRDEHETESVNLVGSRSPGCGPR